MKTVVERDIGRSPQRRRLEGEHDVGDKGKTRKSTVTNVRTFGSHVFYNFYNFLERSVHPVVSTMTLRNPKLFSIHTNSSSQAKGAPEFQKSLGVEFYIFKLFGTPPSPRPKTNMSEIIPRKTYTDLVFITCLKHCVLPVVHSRCSASKSGGN